MVEIKILIEMMGIGMIAVIIATPIGIKIGNWWYEKSQSSEYYGNLAGRNKEK